MILANLSPFLVYPVAAGDTPPYERIAWWKIIFSYLGIKKKEQLEIRWMCRRYPPEAKTNGRYQAILAQLGGRLHIIHGENFPHGYEKRCRKEGG
mgnify:CR=1 FL=1